VRYIAVKHKEKEMDQHIKKVYVPMTETAFYILLCLREPNHGYGIVQTVEKLTEGAIRLAPGTMYGSLSKMERTASSASSARKKSERSTTSRRSARRSLRLRSSESSVFTRSRREKRNEKL
jgi:DNA-binding PadR family transcriptional regulator